MYVHLIPVKMEPSMKAADKSSNEGATPGKYISELMQHSCASYTVSSNGPSVYQLATA